MNMRIALSGLAVVMVAGAPALVRQIDGGMPTCAKYTAMDAPGKIAAANAVNPPTLLSLERSSG